MKLSFVVKILKKKKKIFFIIFTLTKRFMTGTVLFWTLFF